MTNEEQIRKNLTTASTMYIRQATSKSLQRIKTPSNMKFGGSDRRKCIPNLLEKMTSDKLLWYRGFMGV